MDCYPWNPLTKYVSLLTEVQDWPFETCWRPKSTTMGKRNTKFTRELRILSIGLLCYLLFSSVLILIKYYSRIGTVFIFCDNFTIINFTSSIKPLPCILFFIKFKNKLKSSCVKRFRQHQSASQKEITDIFLFSFN